MGSRGREEGMGMRGGGRVYVGVDARIRGNSKQWAYMVLANEGRVPRDRERSTRERERLETVREMHERSERA